jgi:sporulation protein YlmC with PRC-barrel domain
VLPRSAPLHPLKFFQRATAALVAAAIAGSALGSDLRDARYDAATDTIIVEVAYEGTNPNHEFSVQWGRCENDAVAGRLVDSQWNDRALEPYRLRDHVSIDDIPCRPARVTLRMGRTGQATVIVPAKESAAPRARLVSSPGVSAEVRASELVGREVRATAGERLGDIAAVLIDSRPRGAHFVVLAAPGGERFGIPVSDLHREGDGLRLDVPPRHLELIPGFEGRRWPDAEHRIERYERASALLGRAAEDPLGNAVGTLRDVAIDLDTGRTRYFLVEFAAENNAVLPLAPHLVRLRPGENPVVTGRPHRRS